MDNVNLLQYIQQARKSGMEDNKIREGLLQAGWPVSSVEEAIMKVPVTDIPQPRPRAMMSKSLAVVFTVIAITVAGYFAGAYYMVNFQSFPLWPFEVSVPVPTFTPRPQSAIKDPTFDWNVYRNEEYGLEFKYPGEADLKYFEKEKLIVLHWIKYNYGVEEVPALYISLVQNPDKLSAQEYYDGEPGQNLFGDPGGEYTVRVISGEESYKFVPVITFSGTVVVIIPKGSSFIEIEDEGTSFQANGIFDQILSTFKFIE